MYFKNSNYQLLWTKQTKNVALGLNINYVWWLAYLYCSLFLFVLIVMRSKSMHLPWCISIMDTMFRTWLVFRLSYLDIPALQGIHCQWRAIVSEGSWCSVWEILYTFVSYFASFLFLSSVSSYFFFLSLSPLSLCLSDSQCILTY